MTDQQARAKFEKVCHELHGAGWDVLAAISKSFPGGTDTVQRVLLHGDGEEAQARAFLRCNRAFKEDLARAADGALRASLREPKTIADFLAGSCAPQATQGGAR